MNCKYHSGQILHVISKLSYDCNDDSYGHVNEFLSTKESIFGMTTVLVSWAHSRTSPGGTEGQWYGR